MSRPSKYDKKDCIDSLCEAAEILGESPSHNQYQSLDIKPSASAIQRICGGWNNAKEMAGLNTDTEPRADEKPELVDYTLEEWKELSGNIRTRHRKAAKLARMKLERGCERCGYDECRYALDWHHTGEKEANISTMLTDGISMDKILDEVDECEVVCANCHRELTYANN